MTALTRYPFARQIWRVRPPVGTSGHWQRPGLRLRKPLLDQLDRLVSLIMMPHATRQAGVLWPLL